METSLSPQDPEADWSKIRPVLDEALNHLRDEDREAVLLRFFQQRSFAEIGGALRLSEEAARKRVDRALDRLRSMLAKHGVVSTAAALSTTLSAAIVESPVTLGATVTQAALQSSAVTVAAVTVAGAIKVLLPAAAAAVLGCWLVTQQHAANGSLEAEVRRLSAVQLQVTRVRHENGELSRQLSAIEQVRSEAATLPALQRASAEANPMVERRSVVVTITSEGTIRWGDRPVTLARFVHELKQLNASARDGATLVIRSDGASFDAFSYAVDEARLHGIGHVVVERTGGADSHLPLNWF